MSNIIQSIHDFECMLGESAMCFATRHPFLSFGPIFIGIPVCIIAAVSAMTAVFMLPIAWACGWL